MKRFLSLLYYPTSTELKIEVLETIDIISYVFEKLFIVHISSTFLRHSDMPPETKAIKRKKKPWPDEMHEWDSKNIIQLTLARISSYCFSSQISNFNNKL